MKHSAQIITFLSAIFRSRELVFQGIIRRAKHRRNKAQNILSKPQFKLAITYVSTPCGNHTITHFRGTNNTLFFSKLASGPGGRTPLYKLYRYRYVPPHRVGFLRRFGLKTDIHFAHFGLGVYERIYRFISK